MSAPQNEDAVFARAVVAFGLATEAQVRACEEELPGLRAKGRIKTLAQLLVLNGVISPNGYQRLRERIAKGEGGALVPPEITSSGSYKTLAAEAPPPSASQLDAAAGLWRDARSKSSSGTAKALKPRRDHEIRASLGVGDEPDQFEVGPYRVLGEIGAGGAGMVYRAVDGAGQPCALKLLLSQDSEKRLKRLISEARISMSLEHSGIVKVRDVGLVNDVAYLAMDLIEGKDLQRCLEERAFPERQELELLVKVCGAVHHAHEKGVIHRDIKPGNVLVRNDGVPLLTDFGLAKDLNVVGKLSSTTDNVVGTPYYIAPEQLAGAGHVNDPRVDVYALGVILFQILTRTVPFQSKDISSIYIKIRSEEPPLPTALRPEVSPEIEKVCLQALAKDPAERYPSAAAFAADIQRFLNGEPVQAKKRRGTGVLGGLVDFFRRKPPT